MRLMNLVTAQPHAPVTQSITPQHYWLWSPNSMVMAPGLPLATCVLFKEATFPQKQLVPRSLIQSWKVWEDLGNHRFFFFMEFLHEKTSREVRHNQPQSPLPSVQCLGLQGVPHEQALNWGRGVRKALERLQTPHANPFMLENEMHHFRENSGGI